MKRFEPLYIAECVFAMLFNGLFAALFAVQLIAERLPHDQPLLPPAAPHRAPSQPAPSPRPTAVAGAGSPHNGATTAAAKVKVAGPNVVIVLPRAASAPVPPVSPHALAPSGGGGGGGAASAPGGVKPLPYYVHRLGFALTALAVLYGVDPRGSAGRLPTYFLTAVATVIICCILLVGVCWMRATMLALTAILRRPPWHGIIRALAVAVALYGAVSVGGYSVAGPLLDRGWCVCFDDLGFGAYNVFACPTQLVLYALMRRELTRFVTQTAAAGSSVSSQIDTSHVRVALRRMAWFVAVFGAVGAICTAAWIVDCRKWLDGTDHPIDAARPGAASLDDDYPVASALITTLMTPMNAFICWFGCGTDPLPRHVVAYAKHHWLCRGAGAGGCGCCGSRAREPVSATEVVAAGASATASAAASAAA